MSAIQALTEWLPISSSGHLKIVEKFFGLNVPILFDVALHLGTLVVTLIFFRREVKSVFSSLMHLDFGTDGKLIPLIIVGSFPTALIGLAIYIFLEKPLQEISAVAVSLIVCGLVLYSAKVAKENRGNIDFKTAFMIGVAQGIAVIPGLSRSGLTITTALLLGVKRDEAFKFSFLLSVPAVLGAFFLTLQTFFNDQKVSDVDFSETFVGVIVAMVVGYLALKLLWKILEGKRIHVFAFYCWILGALLLIVSCINVF